MKKARKMKNGFLYVMTMLLVIALIAGCGNGGGGAATTTAAAAAAETTTAAAAEEISTHEWPEDAKPLTVSTLPIVQDKITLSVFQGIRDGDAIVLDGLWYADKIEADTNIHIEYVQVNASDWNTQLNLMFASDDYTDIIVAGAHGGNIVDSEIYGVDQGILVPLNDLIDEYMPVYKSRLEGELLTWQSLVKTDGLMYAVGYTIDYGSVFDQSFFINQTWLDKLGLATPTDTEELYDVLRAFIDEKPLGGGEVGYQGDYAELTSTFFHLWGIPENSTQRFSITDEREVVFNPFLPGYRECIEYMARLYSDGLMDPAVITQDTSTKSTKLNQNNVGLVTRHRLMSGGTDILLETMVHLDPPAAPGYEPLFWSQFSVAEERVFFTKANKYLAESAKWVDYQLEDQPTFESFYGPQGNIWDWNAENKCEIGPAGDQGVYEYALGVCGIAYLPAFYYNQVFVQPDYRVERMEYCEKYIREGWIQKYPNRFALNFAKISADDQTIINRNFANIKALYDEMVSDMIMRGVTDAKWDTFMTNLEAAGANEYIAIYQKVLDEYFENNPM